MTFPEGAVRTVPVSDFFINVTATDKYLLVERDCAGTVVQTGFQSRGKMMVRYANRLRHMITMEPISGVGIEGKHLTLVACLSFKDDGSGLMSWAPVIFPQPDQETEDCTPHHLLKESV